MQILACHIENVKYPGNKGHQTGDNQQNLVRNELPVKM
jgi:hypothetical protein